MARKSKRAGGSAKRRPQRTANTKTPTCAKKAQARNGAPNARGATAFAESKSGVILAMLRRKSGASVEELAKATGWRDHSIRGFLSGTVKKKLDLDIDSAKSESGVRRYFVKGA